MELQIYFACSMKLSRFFQYSVNYPPKIVKIGSFEHRDEAKVQYISDKNA